MLGETLKTIRFCSSLPWVGLLPLDQSAQSPGQMMEDAESLSLHVIKVN